MPLTLTEIQSLIAALGVKIPEDILAQRAKAEEFTKRREKLAAEAGGKPAEWRLRAKFDDTLKRADDAAGKKQYDPALALLDEAGQLLQQPDISPEVLAALKALAERKASLEAEISRVQAFESPVGAELKSGLAAVATALGEDNADAAEKRLGELEQTLKIFEQQRVANEAQAVAAAEALKAGQEAKASDAPAADGGFSLVNLQKSRLAWDGLRKTVRAQLEQIEQSVIAGVRAHNADETAEDEFEEGEVGAAVKTLYTILGEHDQRLLDKLDEALNAKSDEQRRGFHQEAGGIIKEYQSFVASDATLAMIDENGFTNSTIRTAVADALNGLAGKF